MLTELKIYILSCVYKKLKHCINNDICCLDYACLGELTQLSKSFFLCIPHLFHLRAQVRVCVCGCGCGCVCACVYRSQRSLSGVLIHPGFLWFLLPFYLFLSWCLSLTSLDLTNWASLAGQRAPGTRLSCNWLGFQAHTAHHAHAGSGDQT